MKETFHFSKENRKNWRGIAIECYGVIKHFLEGFKDFEIEVRQKSNKRSGQQLKSYWRLVTVITNYMNEQGNMFGIEEVSNWIKLKSGHYTWIDSDKIARSISNKSDTTIKEMRAIIEFILHFGIEHNIQGCEISDIELDNLLKYYDK